MLSSVERAQSILPQPLRFAFQVVLWRTVADGRVQSAGHPLSARWHSCFANGKEVRAGKTSSFSDARQHGAVTQSGLFLWASTALPGGKFMRAVAAAGRGGGSRSKSDGRNNADKAAAGPDRPGGGPASNPAGPECVPIGFWRRTQPAVISGRAENLGGRVGESGAGTPSRAAPRCCHRRSPLSLYLKVIFPPWSLRMRWLPSAVRYT